MSDSTPQDWERIYEWWSTEKLLRAVAQEAHQFNPAALPVMRKVLNARGVTDDDIAAAAESRPVARLPLTEEQRFSTFGGPLIPLAIAIAIQSALFVFFGIALGSQFSNWGAPLVALPVFVLGLYGFYCTVTVASRRPRSRTHLRTWLGIASAMDIAFVAASSLPRFGDISFIGWFGLVQFPLWYWYATQSRRLAWFYGQAEPDDRFTVAAQRRDASTTSTHDRPAPASGFTATQPDATQPAFVKPDSRATYEVISKLYDLSPGDRVLWLKREFPNDMRLQAHYLELLPTEPAAAPAPLSAPRPATPSPGPEGLAGTRIGPWEVLERLEIQGAMSTVYRGRRADGLFDADVAIKVIPFDPGFLARFHRERQFLGALNHNNIVRILDAGTTTGNLPYLVMEWVDGQLLDDYVEQTRPSLATRLHLFLKICDAIQHAHQKLIVHRDLKPHNVMIGAGGIPKVLDFGVAKLMSSGPGEKRMFNTIGDVAVFTPGYASPEQITGAPITTATDVYALGMILYELLTGAYPFPEAKASTDTRAVEHIVCHDDPVPPSRAQGEGWGVAKRLLHGDLNAIVLKTLRKDSKDRYQTVKELADDVERHLGGKAVLARREFGYATRKWAQAWAIPLAGAATVIVALAISLVAVARSNAANTALLMATQASLANALVQQSLDAVAPRRAMEIALRALQADPTNRAARSRVSALLQQARFTSRRFEALESVAFDSSGQYLVVQDARRVLVLTLDLKDVATVELPVEVSAAAFDARTKRLAVATLDGVVQVFNVSDTAQPAAGTAFTPPVSGLAFNPSSDLVVAARGTIETWSPESNRKDRLPLRNEVRALAPDGKSALVEAGEHIELVAVNDGHVIQNFSSIAEPSFAGDGQVVLSRLADTFTTGDQLPETISFSLPSAGRTSIGATKTIVWEEAGRIHSNRQFGSTLPLPMMVGSIDGLLAHPAAAVLITWSNGDLRVWESGVPEEGNFPPDSSKGDAKSLELTSDSRSSGASDAVRPEPGQSLQASVGNAVVEADADGLVYRAIPGQPPVHLPFAFSGSSRWALSATGAVAAADRTAEPDGAFTTVWTIGSIRNAPTSIEIRGRLLGLHPDGRTVAVINGAMVSLRDTQSGVAVYEFELFSLQDRGSNTYATLSFDERDGVLRVFPSVYMPPPTFMFSVNETSDVLIERATELLRDPRALELLPEGASSGSGQRWRDTGTCLSGGQPSGSHRIRLGAATGLFEWFRFAPGEDCQDVLRVTASGRTFLSRAGPLRAAANMDTDNDGIDEIVSVDESGGNGSFHSQGTIYRAARASDAVSGGWSPIAAYAVDHYGNRDGESGLQQSLVFRDLDGDERRETVCVVERLLGDGDSAVVDAWVVWASGRRHHIPASACVTPSVGSELSITNNPDYPVRISVRSYPRGQSALPWPTMGVRESP